MKVVELTVELSDIKQAANTLELEGVVKQAVNEYGYELNNSNSYAEDAEVIIEQFGGSDSDLLKLANLLLAAEERWNELEY